MYNHLDPPASRLPLPIRLWQSNNAPACHLRGAEERTVCVAAGNGRALSLRLISDSSHLLRFFEGNWSSETVREPEATIVALKGQAAAYGLSGRLDGSRWYSPSIRAVWMYGSEYYGNLKITVRGLCSELAAPDDMFIHGCAMSAGNLGLLLMGASGAGKTTITAALHHELGASLRIVNDDWGVLNIPSAIASYTGEKALHMKYRSVRAVAPAVEPDPSRFASENFGGDVDDPHARLLIPRERVFGEVGVADQTKIDRVVLLARSNVSRPSFRRIGPANIPDIEAGAYSSFYRREEPFFNGSLFLTDSAQIDRCRREFERLASTIPFFLVENGGEPQAVAEMILHLPV
ncbi:MAG TPA: hypothetical protein VF548_06375 [Allosphingosinicella sp.]